MLATFLDINTLCLFASLKLVIPNYHFPPFLFLQDGCDFVCRSKPRNVPAAYRGVGDDQLGEESEERDDHLLPM